MVSDAHLPWAVILTALPVEYLAIREHLRDVHEDIHPQGTIYEKGLFIAKKPLWNVAVVAIQAGNVRAAFEAERAIERYQPGLILFVGVAGGLKDVTLGDVVVATKVYGYESGKAGDTFKSRPEVGNSTYRMVQRAQVEARKKDWLRRIGRTIPAPSPRVFIGAIAAGEKVVVSTRSDAWKLLKTSYEDSLAVDMEDYGFLQATHARQHVEALIIRGISNLIEDKSKADAANFQEIAARHASAFAFEILAKLSEDTAFYAPQLHKGQIEEPGQQASELPNKQREIIINNHGPVQGQQIGNGNVQNIKTGRN